MHTSFFIGGPLHRKKTDTKLNICRTVIFRDKQYHVHLYEKIGINDDSTKVFYHYLGLAEKNQDGEWIPIAK
jgi:hypothetical protein